MNAQTKEERRALFLSKDELMRHEAAGAATSFFPKAIEMAGVSMALSYHFEPGSPRDGVTMTVPLFCAEPNRPRAGRVARAGDGAREGAGAL